MNTIKYIILNKQQLEEIAKAAPDKASLVDELIKHHVVSLGDNQRFILCGPNPDGTPFFLGMGTSLDAEFLAALKDAVEETFDHANEEERAQLSKRIFSNVYPDLVALVRASAANGAERETVRHLPILPFYDLEPAESNSLASLLQDARDKAESMELSAFQLFVEGKLEKLMGDDSRLIAFNQLSDYKKKQARRQIIEQMSWKDYYTA